MATIRVNPGDYEKYKAAYDRQWELRAEVNASDADAVKRELALADKVLDTLGLRPAYEDVESTRKQVPGALSAVCGWTLTTLFSSSCEDARGVPARHWGEPVMNAAETIEAAIEMLRQMTVEADMDGPWRVEYHTEKAASIFDSADVPVALDITPVDARTITALHRTIDAELAILQLGMEKSHPFPATFPASSVEHAALDLARAIVGES